MEWEKRRELYYEKQAEQEKKLLKNRDKQLLKIKEESMAPPLKVKKVADGRSSEKPIELEEEKEKQDEEKLKEYLVSQMNSVTPSQEAAAAKKHQQDKADDDFAILIPSTDEIAATDPDAIFSARNTVSPRASPKTMAPPEPRKAVDGARANMESEVDEEEPVADASGMKKEVVNIVVAKQVLPIGDLLDLESALHDSTSNIPPPAKLAPKGRLGPVGTREPG